MRPENVDVRYTRRARRDSERVSETYEQNRRATRRGNRVRAADRQNVIVQSVTVYPYQEG